jgi:gliding motility-associated-like protein
MQQPVVGTHFNFGGTQTPYSGNGYLGGYFTCYMGGAGTDGYNGPGWWEYIQGNLTQPLKNDNIYQLSLKLSVAELSDLMINEIGVFFSNSPISSENTSNLNVTPQCTFYEPNFFSDTIEWIDLKALFMANGGEKFITIGNFKDVYNTDTLRRFNWEPLYVNPYCTYMFVDNVQLVESEIQIPNVFTPNGDGVNDFVPFPNFGNSTNNIVVVNRWGNLVFESNGINPIWDGKDTSGKSCTEGTYFYRINNTNISGFIQLIR